MIGAMRAAARPLRRAGSTILDLVLPPRCPGCREIVADDGRFCEGCWATLRFITAPQCAACGTPFDHDRGDGAQCGACLLKAPKFTTARAALSYEGAARDVLLGYKHGDRQHLARLMVPQLARVGAPVLGRQALLVPVPLHWTRLWTRGFNQAALLARGLSKRTGTPLAVDALIRVRRTALSRGLGRRARAENVRSAFRVARRSAIRGRHVVLVDDVLTTGATADACARVLLRGGATRVDVLTWARVVRDG